MAELGSPALAPAPERPAHARAFELGGITTILLPGFYAWGATVAWPAFAVPGSSPVARAAAALSVVLLIGGPLLARRHLRAGRALGVLGFVGASAAAWGALDAAIRPPQLDTVRAALGALAWGLFALGWGTFPGRTRLPEDDPHAVLTGRLPPRARLPRAVTFGFAALLAAALALPLLAWRVERPGVALLGHAVALAGAVALLGVGSHVLLAPKGLARSSPSRLWIGVLLLWLLLGALLELL
ncbi:MAG TPA: hypothetical protein VNN80_02335 [Polyangiaceae bacterium]|nr:hypothetical protein [Polyangiaceae bacterium]